MANQTLHHEQVLPWADIVRNIERVRRTRAADIDASRHERAERLPVRQRVGRWLHRLGTAVGNSVVTSCKCGWLFLLITCVVLPLTVPVLLITS